MQFKNSKYVFLVVGALALLFVVFNIGVYVGYANRPEVDQVAGVTNKEGTHMAPQPSDVDFEPFWKAWNILKEHYVDYGTTTPKASDQDKVWGAIEGLANSLGDPYTVFLPPKESEIFATEIQGNFEGVGMEVAIRNGILTVVSPLKGTPAARAGILAGDMILKIGDKVTANMTVEDAVSLIRGPRGSTVSLTILHEGSEEPKEIKVVRDVITLPTIDTEIKNSGGKQVFVIHLYNFSSISPRLFRESLLEFVNSGSEYLVLDLRGNPGGYLDAAVDMASWFLPEGKVVVRENFGPGKEEKVHRSTRAGIFTSNLKMVVLVDQGSASASEILAGALSEHGVATLVGSRTFGKGSVQELVPVTEKTALKITIARWLTPNGNSISEKGLEPEVSVALTREDVEAGKDPQLDKALEVVAGK